jgi:type IV pilus assembly PilN-like protein/type II secretion system (T2SS) protein L
MGQRILALELGGDRVRAAMADRTWNSLELLGAYEQQRSDDEPDLSGAIARVLRAAGKPDIVISALPGEFVAKRLLTLPFSDNRRLQQVVPFALEEHLPFPVDDAAVAFARVGREGPNTLVIAAFARKDDLRHHLELLARCGLDPKTVTLSTLALAGLLARARNGHGGAHLVVEVDHASTSMVLIDAEGTPRAMRAVGAGLDIGNGNRAALPQAAAAAILGLVRQTLLAHASDHEQPDLVLTGPGASAASSVCAEFAEALAVRVRNVGDFDCSSLIQGFQAEPMRYGTCIAMLLGESPAKPLELLNFRCGEFTFHGRTGSLGALYVPAMLSVGVVAVALLHFILGISASARQLHLLNREIAAITAPALGSQDPATAKGALQGRIVEMSKRLHLMGGSLGLGSPLDVLLALSRAMPTGLPVQISDLEIDDTSVKLQGSADSFATVDQVKKALERSRYFGPIQVEHAAAGTDASKVDFTLDASLGNGIPKTAK